MIQEREIIICNKTCLSISIQRLNIRNNFHGDNLMFTLNNNSHSSQ